MAAGYVYFIQGIQGGPVKIGWAVDPRKRCADLQTGSPVMLVVRSQRPGSPKDERALHKKYAANKVLGEWFEPTPEMEFDALCRLMTNPGERSVYTKTQVAQSLDCSVDFVEDHVWPELRVIKRGRRSVVPIHELERWLAAAATPPQRRIRCQASSS